MNLKNFIQEIPNFPKKGIIFRDFNPLLQNPQAWTHVMNRFGELCDELKPDLIAGIESRGFIVGSSLAFKQQIGFVPIRKAGKLPGKVIGVDYSLEYADARLEIQDSLVEAGSRVLVVDDLLATGGTACAATELIAKTMAKVVGFGFVIELESLNGRSVLDKEVPIFSLISYL